MYNFESNNQMWLNFIVKVDMAILILTYIII